MTVNAIKTNESKPKHASYLKAAALGGLCGYTLKHALPVTPQEKDEYFDKFLEDLKKQTNETKQKEINAIRNSQNRTLAEDKFISLVDKNEVKMSKIKEIQEPLASQVMDIITKINDKGRATIASSKEVYKAVTKYIRPANTFIALGAGIALAGAFLYNTLKRFSEK